MSCRLRYRHLHRISSSDVVCCCYCCCGCWARRCLLNNSTFRSRARCLQLYKNSLLLLSRLSVPLSTTFHSSARSLTGSHTLFSLTLSLLLCVFCYVGLAARQSLDFFCSILLSAPTLSLFRVATWLNTCCENV